MVYYYYTTCLFLLLDLLTSNGQASAYVTANVSGYVFTLPDFQSNSALRTQAEARTWCANNGSKLAEIYNSEIQDYIAQFLSSSVLNPNLELSKDNILTNGKRNIGNWTWVDGKGISNISIAEQVDLSYSYGYMQLTSIGTISIRAARPADALKGYICEGLSNCKSESGFSHSGRCYNVYTDLSYWYDARDACLDGGGDLASFDFITTDGEWNTLNTSWFLFPSNLSTDDGYWIGLRREWWTWQSCNSEIKYSNWSLGRPVYGPAYDCLCLYPMENWRWIECNCSQMYQFICISSDGIKTRQCEATTMKTNSVTSSLSANDYNPENGATGTGGVSNAVSLGVGIGFGVPAVLIIVLLCIAVIILRDKLSHYKSAYKRREEDTADVIPSQALANGIVGRHNVYVEERGATGADSARVNTETASIESPTVRDADNAVTNVHSKTTAAVDVDVYAAKVGTVNNIYGNIDATETYGNIESDKRQDNIDSDKRQGNIESDKGQGNIESDKRQGNIGSDKRKGNIKSDKRQGDIKSDKRQGNINSPDTIITYYTTRIALSTRL